MSNSKSAWYWGIGTVLATSLTLITQVFPAWLQWAVAATAVLVVCILARFFVLRLGKLSQALEQTDQKAESVQGLYQATKVKLEGVGQQLRESEHSTAELQKNLTDREKQIEAHAEKISALTATIDDLQKSQAKTDENARGLAKKAEEQSTLSKAIADKSDVHGKQLNGLSRIVGHLLGQSRDVPEVPTIDWLYETYNSVGHRLGSNNNLLYLSHTRRFTRADANQIVHYWGPRLDMELTVESVGYVADRICQIERKSMGRVAGHIQDAVVRALVLQAVKDEDTKFLEIGSLFGVNALALMDLALPHNKRVHCTAIDPLNGYYGEKVADIATGLPINQSIFTHNFRAHGFSSYDYELIQAFSTDPEVIEKVGLKKFDFLFIDGDHSYDGVKNDFDNYHNSVKVGGYIVFDDYGSPGWEDVKQYVDNEVAASMLVEEVGKYASTAVYRRI